MGTLRIADPSIMLLLTMAWHSNALTLRGVVSQYTTALGLACHCVGDLLVY